MACLFIFDFFRYFASLISSGHSRFSCQFRPRVCPILSRVATKSAVLFSKGGRPHLPSRRRARQTLDLHNCLRKKVIRALLASMLREAVLINAEIDESSFQ